MVESTSPRPLVRPRVVSPHTGERLFLEDFLEPILQSAELGAICISGARGAGKSTALRSLSGKLPPRTIIELLDEPSASRVAELAERMVVIYTAAASHPGPHLAEAALAPWDEDEALEYLMGAHPDRCQSVMARLSAKGKCEPLELPELWAICLEQMSADDSIADVDAALRRHLDGLLPGWLRPKARKICFEKTINEQAEGVDEVQLWGQRGFLGFLMGQGLPADGVRLIREPRVRRILASEWLVDPDKGVLRLNGLKSRLPTPLIRMAGQNLGRHPHAVRTLEEAIREDTTLQAMGASLLHASATGWRPPDEGKIHFFLGAHLPGAQWRELKLDHAQFHGAEMTAINLHGAKLGWADLESAQLRYGVLSEAKVDRVRASKADWTAANLRRVSATRANFFGAICRDTDFEGAMLQESRFVGADLTGASFRRADLRAVYFQVDAQGDDWINSFATIEAALERRRERDEFLEEGRVWKTTFDRTDFTGADLQGACLHHSDLRTAVFLGASLARANLMGANLEGVSIPGARLEEARLQGADLTGSVLTGASMRGSFLNSAKLADVDWERVDLRDADLRRATFHLGTSRSGLVFGEPSEGTRNGFYTDDFNDQSYRAPEEIRVANLRGADLRGAKLLGTDFYLVDVREAQYTSEQEAYLRCCGAILESRV